MEILPASSADYAGIRQVLLTSFPDSSEAKLVENLRKSGDAVISLVAKLDDKIVGQVMFSTMSAPFRAMGLGPVSVLESHRKCGIAAKLINAGLSTAKTENWQAVFVLGDPDYYQRFGFTAGMAKNFDCEYSGPYLMALALQDKELPQQSGRVEYAPAFSLL